MVFKLKKIDFFNLNMVFIIIFMSSDDTNYTQFKEAATKCLAHGFVLSYKQYMETIRWKKFISDKRTSIRNNIIIAMQKYNFTMHEKYKGKFECHEKCCEEKLCDEFILCLDLTEREEYDNNFHLEKFGVEAYDILRYA